MTWMTSTTSSRQLLNDSILYFTSFINKYLHMSPYDLIPHWSVVIITCFLCAQPNKINHRRDMSSTRSSCTTSTTTARQHGPRTASTSGTTGTTAASGTTGTTDRRHRRLPRHLQLLQHFPWDQDDHMQSWTTTQTQERRQPNYTTRPSHRSKRSLTVRLTTWPSSLQASGIELAVSIGNDSSRCQSTMEPPETF